MESSSVSSNECWCQSDVIQFSTEKKEDRSIINISVNVCEREIVLERVYSNKSLCKYHHTKHTLSSSCYQRNKKKLKVDVLCFISNHKVLNWVTDLCKLKSSIIKICSAKQEKMQHHSFNLRYLLNYNIDRQKNVIFEQVESVYNSQV